MFIIVGIIIIIWKCSIIVFIVPQHISLEKGEKIECAKIEHPISGKGENIVMHLLSLLKTTDNGISNRLQKRGIQHKKGICAQ